MTQTAENFGQAGAEPSDGNGTCGLWEISPPPPPGTRELPARAPSTAASEAAPSLSSFLFSFFEVCFFPFFSHPLQPPPAPGFTRRLGCFSFVAGRQMKACPDGLNSGEGTASADGCLRDPSLTSPAGLVQREPSPGALGAGEDIFVITNRLGWTFQHSLLPSSPEFY